MNESAMECLKFANRSSSQLEILQSRSRSKKIGDGTKEALMNAGHEIKGLKESGAGGRVQIHSVLMQSIFFQQSNMASSAGAPRRPPVTYERHVLRKIYFEVSFRGHSVYSYTVSKMRRNTTVLPI